jgi:hypothetical protein
MEANDMVLYMAQKLKMFKDTKGLVAAQGLYRTWFITTAIYSDYKADVDLILVSDGYGDVIVTQ